jgi:hypothetical protein
MRGRVGHQAPGPGTEFEEIFPTSFSTIGLTVRQMFCFFGRGSFHVLKL